MSAIFYAKITLAIGGALFIGAIIFESVDLHRGAKNDTSAIMKKHHN